MCCVCSPAWILYLACFPMELHLEPINLRCEPLVQRRVGGTSNDLRVRFPSTPTRSYCLLHWEKPCLEA